LAAKSPRSIVPKTLYLPDGRSVPVCIIEAKKEAITTDLAVNPTALTPEKFLAPGSAIVNPDGQGMQRVATAGCLVKDGQRYYVLTNNHALGEIGSPIKTLTRHHQRTIGHTAAKSICRMPVSEIYPQLRSTNQYLQMDIGLVTLDDVMDWKTTIPGLQGNYGQVVDLYDQNLSLKLIGQTVTGKSAVSGMIRGELHALFYRYKSMGGYEYLCDFLIGPETNRPVNTPDKEQPKLNVHHGDSGTLLFIEQADNYFPLAVLWGRNNLGGNSELAEPYAMATALSTVLNILDLDFVSDINSDESFVWGYIGHYAIGRQLANTVGLIHDPKLKAFLTANGDKIAMPANDIRSVAASPRPLDGDGDSFVPLADVPDNVWKGNVNFKTVTGDDGKKVRKQGPGSRNSADNPNHFADIDLPFTGGTIPGIDGQTLLKLCSDDPDKYLNPDFWLSFYNAPGIMGQYEKWFKDTYDPTKTFRAEPKQKHWGALPFRVWQLYNEMVYAAQQGDSASFLCAGGVLVHYVGDACQPLHCSYMSQGDPNDLVDYTNTSGVAMKKMRSDGVHSGYEDDMVNGNISEIMDKLPGIIAGQTDPIPAISSGFEAAKSIIALVKATRADLFPQTIVDKWVEVQPLKKSQRSVEMWKALGPQTISCMARGSRYLATIWESAWHAEGQNKINITDITTTQLQKLYEGKDFAKSVALDIFTDTLKQYNRPLPTTGLN
jgi:hypothetical protein